MRTDKVVIVESDSRTVESLPLCLGRYGGFLGDLKKLEVRLSSPEIDLLPLEILEFKRIILKYFDQGAETGYGFLDLESFFGMCDGFRCKVDRKGVRGDFIYILNGVRQLGNTMATARHSNDSFETKRRAFMDYLFWLD